MDRLRSDLEIDRLLRAARTPPRTVRPPRPTPFFVGGGSSGGGGKFVSRTPGFLLGAEIEGAAPEFLSEGGGPILVLPLNGGGAAPTALSAFVDYRWATLAYAGSTGGGCSIFFSVQSCCGSKVSACLVTLTDGTHTTTGTTGSGGGVMIFVPDTWGTSLTASVSDPRISVSKSFTLKCNDTLFLVGPSLPDTLFYTDNLGSVTLHYNPAINAWAGCDFLPGGLDYCRTDAYGNPGTGPFPRAVIASCSPGGPGVKGSFNVSANWPISTIDRDCSKPLSCYADRSPGFPPAFIQEPCGVHTSVTGGFGADGSCQVIGSGEFFPDDAHCESHIYSGTYPANGIGLSTWTVSP